MGSADERWFVWADQVNGYGATRAIWSWDSRTGRLRRIMAPRRSIDGEWPSASNPVVRGDYATWSQGATDYVSDVHVVDLSNGRDRVIYSGSASEPFFLSGSVVAWVENVSAPKSKNPDFVLRAANALTGRRVTLPRGLRDLPSFGATTLVTDGVRSSIHPNGCRSGGPPLSRPRPGACSPSGGKGGNSKTHFNWPVTTSPSRRRPEVPITS